MFSLHCFPFRTSLGLLALFAVLYESILPSPRIPEIKKTMRKLTLPHSFSFYFSYSLLALMIRSLTLFRSLTGSRTTTLLPNDSISLMISASS